MSYNISSSKFDNPLLKELLKVLSEYFSEKELPFYVIGATARDIVMKQLLNSESTRHTRDLDIAIAIDNWDRFDEISEGLSKLNNFKKSNHQKQRLYFQDNYELDIVPFGKVANDDGNIYWPPEEDIAMSVKGFSEALKNYLTIRVDDEFEIRVASLSGLFLLKLDAWADRNIETSKDAEDMCYIISNYFYAFEEQYNGNNYHSEVYDTGNFNIFAAGAIWLCYDILKILNADQIEYYSKIISDELQNNEDSRLIEQMMKLNNSVKYDLIYGALFEMCNIFKRQL